MALSGRQLSLWTDVGRIVARLERDKDDPRAVMKYATQLRALVLEAQKHDPENANVRRNPGLVTFLLPNPPKGGDLIARDVIAIVYVHNDDHEIYAHGFGNKEVGVRQRGDDLILTGITKRTSVLAQALPDGMVVLRHKDGRPIWEDL